MLGERFDPTLDCPYPYCYAALDDLTALCEVLLWDVGFDAPLRYLPKRSLAGRSLCCWRRYGRSGWSAC